MSESNQPSHWKSIADAVGADLPEEAFQPEVPAAPEASDAADLGEQASESPLEPATAPSAENTAAKLPPPPPNDWDDLANQLGIEVPEMPTSPVVEELAAPAVTEAVADLDALMGTEEIFEADLVDEDEPEAAEDLSHAATEQETQNEEDPFAAFAAFHEQRSENQTPEVQESSASDRASMETVATTENEVARETHDDSGEATVEDASDDDEDRTHRRRRRRRRHRQRAEESADATPAGSEEVKAESESESESEASEVTDEKKLASETRPERKKRPRRRTGDGDEEKSSRKRNIPSWEEAIAVVVEANIVNHSKTSSRESRGGRGRGRGRGSRKS